MSKPHSYFAEKTAPEATQKKRRRTFLWIPLGPAAPATIIVGLTVLYLTLWAPQEVPVPEGISVPFPPLTRALEPVCAWCGEQPLAVVAAGASILLLGVFLRFSAPRYYKLLAVIAGLSLVITFLSISAPIDRLLNTVKDNLPPERHLPDYLPSKR